MQPSEGEIVVELGRFHGFADAMPMARLMRQEMLTGEGENSRRSGVLLRWKEERKNIDEGFEIASVALPTVRSLANTNP